MNMTFNKKDLNMTVDSFESKTGVDFPEFEWFEINIINSGVSISGISGDDIEYTDVSCPSEDLHDLYCSIIIDDIEIYFSCTMMHDGSCEDIVIDLIKKI